MAVIILNEKGKFVAEYPSLRSVAEEYRISPNTVKDYIKNGKLFKRGKVFFDYSCNTTEED